MLGPAALLCFATPPAVARTVKKAPPAGDTYDYVLGTQTFGPSYQFRNENWLMETAQAIQDMGSHTIKFALDVPKPLHAGSQAVNPAIHTLADVARLDPTVRAVLGMPFTDYLLWAYPRTVQGDPFRPESLPTEYREMYDLTRAFLTAYSGTGKTFYLGNWEGDWHLLHTDPTFVPTPTDVQNMIAWVNNRQKAVDDAKRDTPHRNVQVYCYLEVNRVVDAMQGKTRLANDVLPKTNVDFVSYSSYDALGGDIETGLTAALDYIQTRLPPKPGLSGRRVFIGEYGFPAISHSPQAQDALTRQVMRTGLSWGCPFVLYWEMYNNEVSPAGRPRGFWLIDDHGVPQPVYDTHRRFYGLARAYVADFQKQNHRLPTRAEFGAAAAAWLKGTPGGRAASADQSPLALQSVSDAAWGPTLLNGFRFVRPTSTNHDNKN